MSALVTKIRNSFSDIWLDIDLFFSKFRRKKKALPEKASIEEPTDEVSGGQVPPIQGETIEPAEGVESVETAKETVQKTGIVYAPVKTETSEKEKSSIPSVEEVKKTDGKVIYTDFTICDKFDTIDKTSSISIPCLIIVGKQDKLTPIKYSQFFHEKIKDSTLIVLNRAGHMVMVEQPDEFNRAIGEYIKNF